MRWRSLTTGYLETNKPLTDFLFSAAVNTISVIGIHIRVFGTLLDFLWKTSQKYHPIFRHKKIIDVIHSVGGLAVLAHPAWSLNTPAMIKELHGFDAIEIYNTVSGKGLSRRPDASLIIDMLASDGLILPLFAADDSHYYGTNGWHDECTSFIMVECDSTDMNEIKKAIQSGNFYASTGPEIHLRVIDGTAIVDSSEVSEIVFMSNFSISPDRVFTGDGITHAEYKPYPDETFIRAFVTDKNGNQAWSNCIKLTK